jgi:serine/threonine protein kinase
MAQIMLHVGTYRLASELKHSVWGGVYLANDETGDNENKVVIKLINKDTIKKRNFESYIQREIVISCKLKHPNIINTFDYINTSTTHALVSEFAKNGELFDMIVKCKQLSEDVARNYFKQLIAGVSYMHANNVVHRDLKPENIVIDGNDTLKICDFGLSRFIENDLYTSRDKLRDNIALMMSPVGTHHYRAPEIIKRNGYSGTSCDIWSCGVILYCMLCGRRPFYHKNQNNSNENINNNILLGNYRDGIEYLSKDAADLISKIFIVDPSRRYTIDDIMNHSWYLSEKMIQPVVNIQQNILKYNPDSDENTTNTVLFDRRNNKYDDDYLCDDDKAWRCCCC